VSPSAARGVEALVGAALPRLPAPHRQPVSRRLADHVPAWLFWLEHTRGRSVNTIRAYGDDARMFLAFCDQLGIVHADQVGHQVIEGFGASLHAVLGQTETSVNRRTSALRSLFFYLEREGVVTKNPAKMALLMKQPPRKPPSYMTKPERQRILDVLSNRKSRRGRRNYALVATLFLAGLRVSEVCHLTVEDVDLEAGALYIRNGKGGKDRRVPIPPRLVRILRLWITGQRAESVGADSPWLFLHMSRHHRYNGQPLNTKAIHHLVRHTIVPILGRKVSPHSFRHSYATHIYEESGDLHLAQHLLGHESIRTTSIYAHVTPRKERERLAEYLK
jgi:site-specific recombinase XerD